MLERSLLPAEIQQALLERVGRQPALRRAVRAALPRAGLGGGPAAARDAAGDRRRPPRRALGRREGGPPGCRGRRQGLLGPARCAETATATTLAPLARAQGLPDAASAARRSRARASGPSRTCSLRDVAYGQIPRAERAQKHRADGRVDREPRPPGRPRRAARLSLGLGARARPRRRTGHHGARDARAPRAPRCRRPRLRRSTRSSCGRRTIGDALALWPRATTIGPRLLYRRAHALFRSLTTTAQARSRRRATRCSLPGTTSTLRRRRSFSHGLCGSKAGEAPQMRTSNAPKNSRAEARHRRRRHAC